MLRLAFTATLTFLALSGPAHALTVQIARTGGIGVAARNAPADAARVGPGAPEGAWVNTRCQTWGDPVGPRANRLWWLIDYGGRQFFVADRYLTTPNVANVPVPGEPWCGAPQTPPTPPTPQPPVQPQPQPVQPTEPAPGVDHTAQAVATWARAQLGRVYASAEDRAALRRAGSDWKRRGDGPVGEWSGDCYRFAFVAWMHRGVRPLNGFGTARRTADRYVRLGRLRQGTPPAGAIVFYHWGSYGHAGISLGDGQVISTRGTDGQRLAVRQHGLHVAGLGHRGWVDPR